MPTGKKLWAKKYKRTSKTPRRRRDEAPRKIKTFKSSYSYEIIGRKYPQRSRKMYVQKRDEKTVSHFILLMTRSHIGTFANILIDWGYRLSS